MRQLVEALQGYGCRLTVVDPWVEPGDPAAAGLEVLAEIPEGSSYGAVVAAVSLLQGNGVLLDLKNLMPRELGALRL